MKAAEISAFINYYVILISLAANLLRTNARFNFFIPVSPRQYYVIIIVYHQI